MRAASRSTTWIHGAPASANDAATATGSSPYDGLGVVVALAQADDVAAAQVDRRVQRRRVTIDHPASGALGADADEVGQQREPGGARLLGVELGGEHVAAPERGVDRAAVVARGGDHVDGSSGTPCSECTKYTHGSSPRPANIGSSAMAHVEPVPLHLRALARPAGSSGPCPAMTPRPRAAGVLLAAVEQHLHADADAEERPARRDGVERRLLEPGRRAARPCTHRTRRRRAARRRRRRRSARVGGEAGVGAQSLAAPSAPSAGCRCRSRARRPAGGPRVRVTGRPWSTARRRALDAHRVAQASGRGP